MMGARVASESVRLKTSSNRLPMGFSERTRFVGSGRAKDDT